MIIKCAYCGNENDFPTGKVNRARNNGLNIYCDRKCAGLGRRTNKTIQQKKEEKRIYDNAYRLRNSEKIKIKKSEYFKRDYAKNPEKYKEFRIKRMPKHLEYCRNEKYKNKKRCMIENTEQKNFMVNIGNLQ